MSNIIQTMREELTALQNECEKAGEFAMRAATDAKSQSLRAIFTNNASIYFRTGIELQRIAAIMHDKTFEKEIAKLDATMAELQEWKRHAEPMVKERHILFSLISQIMADGELKDWHRQQFNKLYPEPAEAANAFGFEMTPEAAVEAFMGVKDDKEDMPRMIRCGCTIRIEDGRIERCILDAGHMCYHELGGTDQDVAWSNLPNEEIPGTEKDCCGARDHGFTCNQPDGHKLDHQASDGTHVIHTWPLDYAEVQPAEPAKEGNDEILF